jgi:nicotinate phosphoribosyltransferase
VRLDSGDLATDARLVRAELDRAGLYRVRIVASGGLDEHGIAALRATGAPVDVFAVGTSVGVSSDAPALDTAYKLVQFAGRPVLKLSPGKASAPSAKQVWRVRDSPGPIDTLALRTELPIGGCEPLLQPLMAGGRRLRDREPLRDGLARFRTDLANLTPRARDLEASEPATCQQSAALADLTEVLVGRHRGDQTARA